MVARAGRAADAPPGAAFSADPEPPRVAPLLPAGACRCLREVPGERWGELQLSALPLGLALRVSKDCFRVLVQPLQVAMDVLVRGFPHEGSAVADYGFDWSLTTTGMSTFPKYALDGALPVEAWCLFHRGSPMLRSAWSVSLSFWENGDHHRVCQNVTIHNLAGEDHARLRTHTGGRFADVAPACPFFVSFVAGMLKVTHDLPLLPAHEQELHRFYGDACRCFMTFMMHPVLPLEILRDMQAYARMQRRERELRAASRSSALTALRDTCPPQPLQPTTS